MVENLTGRWLAGRYILQQFLGRGSLGDVYKAWDRQRALHLSLKLLPLDLAEDKLFLSNFQRDSQSLIRLQHTYLCQPGAHRRWNYCLLPGTTGN